MNKLMNDHGRNLAKHWLKYELGRTHHVEESTISLDECIEILQMSDFNANELLVDWLPKLAWLYQRISTEEKKTLVNEIVETMVSSYGWEPLER